MWLSTFTINVMALSTGLDKSPGAENHKETSKLLAFRGSSGLSDPSRVQHPDSPTFKESVGATVHASCFSSKNAEGHGLKKSDKTTAPISGTAKELAPVLVIFQIRGDSFFKHDNVSLFDKRLAPLTNAFHQ